MNRSPNLVSLFSGCGGFDLGFLARGFISKAAYDNDAVAEQNFLANVGDRIINADLTRSFPNYYSLKEIDTVVAGPPCQGFSTAGKRQLDDKRNHLLTLTGTLALKLAPKVLVVENVSGSLSGHHANYFAELNSMMRIAGYRTNTIRCEVANLGMAQTRKRVLFFAWRTGRDIQFPFPQSAPSDLRAVLRGVSKHPNHNPTLLVDKSRDFLIAKQIKPGQKLSNVRGGSNAVPTWNIPEVFGQITKEERTVLELVRLLRRQDRLRDHGDADPVSLSRLETALGDPFHRLLECLILKGYLRRLDNGIDLVGTFNGKYRRLRWDQPSCTVDTRFGSPRYFLHPSKHRGFTVREAARIQGFRDTYTFQGSTQAQYRLIGNAVPPPLGSFAADTVKLLLGQI